MEDRNHGREWVDVSNGADEAVHCLHGRNRTRQGLDLPRWRDDVLTILMPVVMMMMMVVVMVVTMTGESLAIRW